MGSRSAWRRLLRFVEFVQFLLVVQFIQQFVEQLVVLQLFILQLQFVKLVIFEFV
jgi:hypothetical protein